MACLPVPRERGQPRPFDFDLSHAHMLRHGESEGGGELLNKSTCDLFFLTFIFYNLISTLFFPLFFHYHVSPQTLFHWHPHPFPARPPHCCLPVSFLSPSFFVQSLRPPPELSARIFVCDFSEHSFTIFTQTRMMQVISSLHGRLWKRAQSFPKLHSRQ